VYTIRQSAIVNLRKLVEVFGLEWARTKLLPPVFEATQANTNYLYRMSALAVVTVLASTVGHETLTGTMLPVVLTMRHDPVPNIRFNVAKSLQSLIAQLDAAVVQDQVKPCLIQLAEDDDKDVRYFASQALHSC